MRPRQEQRRTLDSAPADLARPAADALIVPPELTAKHLDRPTSIFVRQVLEARQIEAGKRGKDPAAEVANAVDCLLSVTPYLADLQRTVSHRLLVLRDGGPPSYPASAKLATEVTFRTVGRLSRGLQPFDALAGGIWIGLSRELKNGGDTSRASAEGRMFRSSVTAAMTAFLKTGPAIRYQDGMPLPSIPSPQLWQRVYRIICREAIREIANGGDPGAAIDHQVMTTLRGYGDPQKYLKGEADYKAPPREEVPIRPITHRQHRQSNRSETRGASATCIVRLRKHNPG